MKDVYYIMTSLLRTLRYHTKMWVVHSAPRWRRLIWRDRVCKIVNCDKHVFTWHTGPYCWLHYPNHRVQTIIIILKKSPK